MVTLSKNLWHCWTRCGGGDVVDLVRCLDGTSYGQTAQTLATLADAAPSQGELLLAPVKRPFRPFTRSLPLDPRAPLLEHKGILPVTARRFEVGAYRGSGFLAGCVGVRLHDLEGYPLGYAGRRLDPIEAHRYGKWKYPQRLPKSELLYGYHRVSSRLDNAVVVVECPWGVMRLTQLGIPAVALLGTHLSRAQRAVLVAIPRVLLMLDGDSAGRSAAVDIERAIGSDTEVGLIRLADGCDPDDLSDEELLIKADHLLV